MQKNRLFNHIIIYTLLFIGFICLYVIDIEHVIFPKLDEKVESAVDFVYQQF